ncbi:MAG: hypothetical protein J0I20_07710 [Chloroflexi bacterium]|nr:hypothetical protein [Chloroflexota bacterium]OJV95302.1 MAG: hypothetical protein BGO39_25215 [Chloroflexi bacterium 54-19]
MEQHLNILFSAHSTSERYQKQAAHFRLVKEARLAQANTRPSLKQLLGLQLIAFGRKLAQDTKPAFVE